MDQNLILLLKWAKWPLCLLYFHFICFLNHWIYKMVSQLLTQQCYNQSQIVYNCYWAKIPVTFYNRVPYFSWCRHTSFSSNLFPEICFQSNSSSMPRVLVFYKITYLISKCVSIFFSSPEPNVQERFKIVKG